MTSQPRLKFKIDRKFLPLLATVTLFIIAYAYGASQYKGMRDVSTFLNLFIDNAFLLIAAVGATFVILTGGIDLSVGAVIALTSVASAQLLEKNQWSPYVVIPLVLLIGTGLGAIMGAIIHYFKVQPFIVTLAGMFFARGMCFFISLDAITISDPLYRSLSLTRIYFAPRTFISLNVVIALIILIVGMYLAHRTRFGRTVYAIGGSEQSALLMGLPVARTKVLVYTLSGFCNALAGIVFSIYLLSGHGLYAPSFELDVISSVVIGGTLLSGGVGYVFGTLFGVLVIGLIQMLIMFNGELSSWWTRIAIGLLTLLFIGVQSAFAASARRREAQSKSSHRAAPRSLAATVTGTVRGVRRRSVAIGAVAVAVVVIAVLAISNLTASSQSSAAATTACERKPFRQETAAELMRSGAVVVLERNGGVNCVDELHTIYPDGRIVSDDGAQKIEKQITSAEVEKLLAAINDKGWFTDSLFDTWHTPCRQCFGYYVTVSHQGQEKTVKGVDGGTDAPVEYWSVVALVNDIIPKFEPAP
jgi:simple sugar transport system permease protein